MIPKDIFNQEVTVNDCLSLQLQGNYHYDDKVSELVTVVRNNSSQPQWLLAGETVFSIDSSLDLQEPNLKIKSKELTEPIDLSESDLNESQRKEI